MAGPLTVEVIPVGADTPTEIDYDLEKSPSCSALFMKSAVNWKKSSLEIKWDSSERAFTVEFTGKGRLPSDFDNLLSKRVPLQIARSSTCECGSVLELGDYSILMDGSDFKFFGNYFCPSCKIRLSAEKKGLKRILETWFTGLKKLEIKATGVGIERA